MHFIRGRKSTPELQRTPNIASLRSGPEDTMRVLGVIVDKRLKWHAQIENTLIKAKRLEAALRRITAATWGTTVETARRLYISMIRPAVMYGSEV